MPAGSLDDYVNSVGRCMSIGELMSVFRDEIESEGFQNIVLLRMGSDDGLEITYADVPQGLLNTYLAENFPENDPVRAAIPRSAHGFRWDDLLAHGNISKPARDVMGVFEKLGVHSAMTLIFHGAGGRSGCFSLSCRDHHVTDATRREIVNLKTYTTWLRLIAIEANQCSRRLVANLPSKESLRLEPHADGPLVINAQECRALVIAQTAYRRYQAGLIELSDRLQDIVGLEMFDRLQRRGLIYDEPDDMRWRYYSKPSPIAQAHLKTCAAVTGVRNEIRQLHICASERPVACE